MPPAAILLLSVLGILQQAHVRAQEWRHVLLTDPEALCLDGSPGAYEIKRGVGENASKWVFFQQAGGWCMSPADCLYRSTIALGSTKKDPAVSQEWAIEDLLTSNSSLNPLFSTWTSVVSRYCDGSSRSSHVTMPVVVNGTRLYYRGFPILRATIDALLAAGLATATDLVVGGGSAGALSTTLHVDYIADRVRTANPNIRVAGISNDGFFIDGASIWNSAHIMTDIFKRIVAMGNITAADQVNARCMASTPASQQWRCFMAEYTLPFVQTPMFFLNSFQDQYQAMTMLAPEPASVNNSGGVVEYAPFVACTHTPQTGCNATQYTQWLGLGTQFLQRLRAAITASNASVGHGGYITSCPTHGSCVFGRCSSVRLGGAADGLTGRDALVQWYTGMARGKWSFDNPWPSTWPHVQEPNVLCPSPA